MVIDFYCFNLFLSDFLLFKAAIHGEHWEPILPRVEVRRAAPSIKNPPQNPPPRPPAEMRRKNIDDLEGASYDDPMAVIDEK